MPTSPAGRNQAALDDINYDGLTLPYDSTQTNGISYDGTQSNGIPLAVTGRALTLSIAGGRLCWRLAADGDGVLGRLLQVRNDGFASGAHRGFVPLAAGLSATLTPGRRAVGAVGGAGGTLPGYIRDAGTSAAYANTQAAEWVRGRAVTWDNSDLNNVMVDLG
jgi:hypothetical protein